MPMTPFHLGPAFFLGILLNRFLNFSTFVISSLILDIEPFLVLFFNLNYPLHGFFHSFLGASFVGIVLAFLMMPLRKRIKNFTAFLRTKEDPSKKAIFLASFFGLYLHILFDAPLYSDLQPFYPFTLNPFYGMLGGVKIYLLCLGLLFMSAIIYIKKLSRTP